MATPPLALFILTPLCPECGAIPAYSSKVVLQRLPVHFQCLYCPAEFVAVFDLATAIRLIEERAKLAVPAPSA